MMLYGPLTRYVKLWVAHAPGTFSPPPTSKEMLVSVPGRHHDTCVTHVPWYMSGSLTRGGGETFPAFPAHTQPTILRIWQEAHDVHIFFQMCWEMRSLKSVQWALQVLSSAMSHLMSRSTSRPPKYMESASFQMDKCIVMGKYLKVYP